MIALCFVLALPAAFAVERPPELVQQVARLEQGVIRGSIPTIQEIRQSLRHDLAGPEDRLTPFRRYALAYADWRLNFILPRNQTADKETLLKESEDNLERIVKSDPDNAEAGSLLAAVYGAQIGTSMWRGMTLGPKSGMAIQRAEKADPENPRVALQKGISAYFTPPAFGGGIDKAERELIRAQALFAKQKRPTEWPNWGELDVLAFRGQIRAKKGDREGARAIYAQALAIAPDFGWVRYALLPALDRPSRTPKQ